MAVSVRTRFEVFKRDRFTCRYCGRTSPEVVLELDHIVPVSQGGGDDLMNLAVSCWDCNRGKAAVPLQATMTGEDPHDAAVLLLERERQLREYNAVQAKEWKRRNEDADRLFAWWAKETGRERIPTRQLSWLRNELRRSTVETIREAMEVAIGYDKTLDWRYVMGVLRNQRDTEESEGARG